LNHNIPQSHHIDRRADLIVATPGDDDDALLTDHDLVAWLRMSRQWFQKARHHGFGPPFTRLGARVYYRRGDVKAWLKARTHQCTAEYLPRSGS
jgi:hypothetical protein